MRKGILKNGLRSLLKLGSEEHEKKIVRRVCRLGDIQGGATTHTKLDPQVGRRTVTEKPGGYFTPSGHYVGSLEEGILGECVACRAIYDRAGEPDRLTLVPRQNGGGGICCGCQQVFCCAHGSLLDDGCFWCDDCAYEKNMAETEKAILGAALRMLLGGNDD